MISPSENSRISRTIDGWNEDESLSFLKWSLFGVKKNRSFVVDILIYMIQESYIIILRRFYLSHSSLQQITSSHVTLVTITNSLYCTLGSAHIAIARKWTMYFNIYFLLKTGSISSNRHVSLPEGIALMKTNGIPKSSHF